MNTFTTEATTAATLTESELFARFLDAPLRFGSASSLLASTESKENARDRCFCFFGFDAECLPVDLTEQIIEASECSATPRYDLEAAIASIESMLDSMRSAHNAFADLCHATLTETSEGGTLSDVLWEWPEKARYVLPITTMDGIKR